MGDREYDISVIVVSYNPELDKLISTLASVIYQRNVSVQLILADDSSKENYFDKVEIFLKSNDFKNYVLFPSEKNNGTVLNIKRTLNVVEAEYIKLISPGDYLYSENTLCNWLQYIREKEALACFGDAVYYSNDGSCIRRVKDNPKLITIYNRFNDYQKVRLNYLVCDDVVLGAKFIVKRDLFEKYLDRIANKVIYAEDSIFRLMLFEGVRIDRYMGIVLWYEFGTGISTKNTSEANTKMLKDWEATNKLIIESEAVDYFGKRLKLIYASRKYGNLIRKLARIVLFPSVIYWRIYGKLFGRYTPIDADMTYFNMISQSGISDKGWICK